MQYLGHIYTNIIHCLSEFYIEFYLTTMRIPMLINKNDSLLSTACKAQALWCYLIATVQSKLDRGSSEAQGGKWLVQGHTELVAAPGWVSGPVLWTVPNGKGQSATPPFLAKLPGWQKVGVLLGGRTRTDKQEPRLFWVLWYKWDSSYKGGLKNHPFRHSFIQQVVTTRTRHQGGK